MNQTSQYTKKRKTIILIGLSMCTSVVFMDSTILPVALPTIQKELVISELGLQWIINSYLLVIACLLLAGGKLSDLLGHRKMFCFGMSIFGFASFLGGGAHSEFFLILSRAILGLGGAIMIPSSMAILVETFPRQERGKYIGFVVAISSVFLSLGPFVGGWFTEVLSWRFVFWINIPIVLMGVWIILAVVGKSPRIKEPFDISGFFLFVVSFFFLIFGLMEAKKWGWLSANVLILFGLSFFFSCVLWFVLKKRPHPFIDYRLFKNKVFTGCNLIIFCAQFLIMITVYWVMYFQKSLGYTPIQAGLLSLISTFPLIICAPLSGYLSDRFGPKIPVMTGFCLTFAGFFWFCFLKSNLILGNLIVGLILFGVGIAIIMTPIGTATVGSVSDKKRGSATGIYNTIRNTAATFSVAVLGSIISNVSYNDFSNSMRQHLGFNSVDVDHYVRILSKNHQELIGVNHLSLETIEFIRESFLFATSRAFFWCNFFCALISLLGLCLSFLFLSNKKEIEA